MKEKLIKFLKTEKFRKLFYYSLHGIGTTIISLASFQLFLYLKIQYLIAFTLSWIFANSYAYFATRKIVFNSKANTFDLIKKEYFNFMTGRFITYIFNCITLFIAVSIFKFDAFISNIVISMIIIVLNYFVGKFIVSKTNSKKSNKIFNIDEL